jgi:predicted dehydrogenase
MTDDLRVAVVGAGYLGRFHALIYSRMPGVRLVGVLDTDVERARSVAKEAGCSVWPDLASLASAVDAVSVVVPTVSHLEVAEPLLSRGVHMLMEKPIAGSREQGERLVSLAERAGATLQIGHLERYNAGVMALADQIDRPRFMEAQRMGGFVERATDVDVVSDLMIHDIDIVLSLMPSELRHISAVGSPVLTDHLDIANARLEFADGAVANVVASRVSETKTRRIRVFQAKKYISLDFVEQTMDIAYPRVAPGADRPEIVRERIQVEPVRPLDRELEDFVDCVRAGRRPLVDGRVGLAALDVALRVQSSIHAHNPVPR